MVARAIGSYLMPEKRQTSYDRVPYESHPYPQCHPDRLATLGRIFGMSPAPVTRCRVLELGCAAGGNLIPMAYSLPESEFVGVDLSAVEIEMGLQVVKGLNLHNVQLKHGSIADIVESWGKFDYILCHGVYSWVPPEVQDRILSVCRANLHEQGIAYVSYNTYPGWHVRQMICQMMLYHARQFDDPKERVDQARALLDFLARSPHLKNHYGKILQEESDLIKSCRDWYLFHDHLADTNQPVYFHQFAEHAGRHGLQYLAESNFNTMFILGFPDEMMATLGRIGQNLIQTEQYMDFLRNRAFRQTLLCHKELELNRSLMAKDVSGLLVASRVVAKNGEVDIQPGRKQTFYTPAGVNLDTDFPITKAALKILRDLWPKALDQDTLFREAAKMVGEAMQGMDERQCRDSLSADLLKCYSLDAVQFRTWQPDFVTTVSPKPKISDLAAYQLEHDLPVVTQIHELAQLDPSARQLARILDGTRDHEVLYEHIERLVKAGTIVGEKDGQPVKDPACLQKAVRDSIETALIRMAQAGLLIG